MAPLMLVSLTKQVVENKKTLNDWLLTISPEKNNQRVLTPTQRHAGLDAALLGKRVEV
jgi:hypothetical protein